MYRVIHSFDKKTPHFFCSNFYPVELKMTLVVPGAEPVEETYPSVEHAYQAAKTYVISERQAFQDAKLYAGMAKKMGQFVTLRRDWDACKVNVMSQLLRLKFSHGDLRLKLLDTAPAMLIEGNWWHDNFWGVCLCPRDSRGCQGARGINNLGKLLMNLREQIQNGDGIADSTIIR